LGEIFSHLFMQKAVFAGLASALVCSILSVYVVLKRMAFIGEGISHSAFGGVALAILLGWNITITTIAFAGGVAVLIGVFCRDRRISEDSAIGILLTTSMALGVVFLNIHREFTADIFGYLFGNILAIETANLVAIGILTVVVITVVAIFYKELFFFSFDEEMARTSGEPTGFLHFLLLLLISLTVVVFIKVVGLILVSALLIIPGAAALLVSRSFSRMMIVAVILGVVSALASLFASYYLHLSTGACMVLCLFLVFLVFRMIPGFRRS